ncbi:Sucrose transporter [Rasamsonia emersonii CBS 393.64]|uniref:Sucrose transporter n=1 Tax=Rasamsonia emersonii (strain ATCC 16479 / CBS 393.64 / IMI 116815) TaxID=1408163 RepID=A0A0F4YVN7_RASE3|nr:Sucrose transporter [Rasamsonia emersonii CBS 393.64]KKA21921.1 Sucrose transporter [Rasamsonia emersonii CBS 393.64]
MTQTDGSVVDENSPLVSPTKANDEVEALTGNGSADRNVLDQTSKSSWYLFILTLSIGGLQIVWSVELSHGSPYLLSLGMSKALLAFVWVAGPLTGTLVQPYIGIRSDNCRISWGKRKPFMVLGGLATVTCLLALAWVREIVGGFLGIFGVQPDAIKITVIVIATILMYCLDFAINTVQAGIRAFIVDNAPAHQQESANAWASRLTGGGNILGYILGYLDLPKIFPIFGNTQFKVLCVIASIALGSTLLISCTYIQERDPRLEGPPASDNPGLLSFFKQVFKSIRQMPPQIRKVCEVQLAAWVGWFPFLFYSTTYIGQLYVNPIFDQHPNLSEDEINKAWEEATRVGTFALLVDAIISFAANVILPLLVVPSYKRIDVPVDIVPDNPPEESEPALPRRPSLSSMPVGTSSEPLLEAHRSSNSSKSVDSSEEWNVLSKLQIPGLTLRRTVVIGIVGISWAVTLWAPFALISAEVAQRDAERRLQRHQAELAESRGQRYTSVNGTQSAGLTESDDVEAGGISDGVTPVTEEADAADQAGIVLGLHNVAVSFPQFLSTLISSAIFKALQKPRGEPWDDSVGWVLRFGGCAALVAAYLTKRLQEKGSK